VDRNEFYNIIKVEATFNHLIKSVASDERNSKKQVILFVPFQTKLPVKDHRGYLRIGT
jgi:hypothetical protein